MIKNKSNIVYSTRLNLEWKKLGNYEAADEIPKVSVAREVLNFAWLTLELAVVFLCSLPTMVFAVYRMFVPPAKKDISGELALVTGGGNGLGRAMVMELVSCGARVAIGDVDLAAAEQTARDACARARRDDAAIAYELDVSSTQSIAQVKKQIVNDFDEPVSILINNAALLPVVSSLSGTDEEVSKIMNVNCLGNIWMYRAFLPSMKERDHGHIVTISSVAGLEPIGFMALYTCSKFGVRGFARALAQELRTQGRAVRVSVAMPYFVATRKGLVDIVKARIPPMDVNKTAAQIIDGMRRNYGEFTVPGYFYYLLTFASTFPERIHDLFRETFWVKIDAD